MDKKEIKAKVRDLLNSGVTKRDAFRQLTGQGVKDSHLAYYIAAHAYPQLCSEHDQKVNVLITIMFVQALVAFFLGYVMGAKIGPNAQLITGTLFALIPLIFAWGFYTHRVGAYNVYVLLSLAQFHKAFDGFTTSPITTSIIVAINISLVAYVWYVRHKLFPDFAFIAPAKVKGEYVFSN